MWCARRALTVPHRGDRLEESADEEGDRAATPRFMSRLLRGLAYGWATLVFIFMTLVWFMIYLRAPSFWEFFKQFRGMVVPFGGESMGYYLMAIVLFSPVLPLLIAAEKLADGQASKTRASLLAAGAVALAILLVIAVVAFVAFMVNAHRSGLL